MTSDRRIKSNRDNARASTGAKSYNGRAHSAKNAFRHGLSISAKLDENLWKEVDAFAAQVAESYGIDHIQAAARKIAEAQLDLRRVRDARHQLLSELIKELFHETPLGTSSWKGHLGRSVMQISKELDAVDRYERRALSRRKFAVRALHTAHGIRK